MTTESALAELRATFENKAVDLCRQLRDEAGGGTPGSFAVGGLIRNLPILCGDLAGTVEVVIRREVH